MISFGKNIKKLREQKGYTQEQVADYLNISQPAYARIENGNRNSWSNYLEPLCVFFEVQPEDLISSDSVIVNQNQRGGNGAFIIYQLSEKLIDQYEIRLKEKDELIKKLEDQLSKYLN